MSAVALPRHVLGAVFPALLLGAVGAPMIFVVVGISMPSGFLDLREASSGTVATYFFTSWLASAVITTPIGGAFWHFLHTRRIDGLASYCLIALASAFMSLVAAQQMPSMLLLAMALANAMLIRLVEQVLRRVVEGKASG